MAPWALQEERAVTVMSENAVARERQEALQISEAGPRAPMATSTGGGRPRLGERKGREPSGGRRSSCADSGRNSRAGGRRRSKETR